jgi:hypothetical protein
MFDFLSMQGTLSFSSRMRTSTITSRRQFLCSAIGMATAAPACWCKNASGLRHSLFSLHGALALDATVSVLQEGAIELESSDGKLVDGFRWAKTQALAYARTDGSIGSWYEAALPGRDAFCMRDVSHMSTGAQFLGLGPRTLNMLRRFAENISASKKWCTWWEITRDGLPAPVDYNNDHDFWYDLPANFDVVDACYRQWLWTRNNAYVDDTFLNFYRHTVTDYVKAWDHDGNGLLEHLPAYGHMGIATYDEDLQKEILVGADLIAAQYAAYRGYAAIERARNNAADAAEFERKADSLKSLYNDHWWDATHNRYFCALGGDGKFHPDLREGDGRCNVELPLYYGLTATGPRTDATLDILVKRLETDLHASQGVIGGVEGRSYMPDIFYQYGRSRAGYSALTALMDPSLKRREYPEVSYTVIGNLGSGLMGIRPSSSKQTIETFPQLTAETGWAALHHVPVGANAISVRHTATSKTELKNETGPEFTWHAGFPVKTAGLFVNGKKVLSRTVVRVGGSTESYCEVRVGQGETCVVSGQMG